MPAERQHIAALASAAHAVAHLTINQPDFRIKPFRAMMGALRVKPEVVLEVSAPLPRGNPDGEAGG